jgi:putative PIG3 family NAD(P)H quinone oxidoreductase
MRAVVLREHGDPDVLRVEEVPDPVPGPEEVVVGVVGTAVNRADVLQRMGLYPPPVDMPLEIPGLELAGRVFRCGSRVSLWEPGDAVMGIVAGGGYAEEAAVHERQLLAVPSTVLPEDAAAIPEVFITAWDALVVQGGLTSGRWALVHAGASGVGTAAIQIAKAIGARVAVTCSAGKAEACHALGADATFERSPHDWPADASGAVPGGFDVILDVVGGDELARNVGAVARQGRIVQVGTMGGGAAQINLGALMGKRASLHGTVLRARPLEEKIAVTRRFAAEMLPLFDRGLLHPVIDSRFPLDAAADAHRRMEANANVGKILLDVSPA